MMRCNFLILSIFFLTCLHSPAESKEAVKPKKLIPKQMTDEMKFSQINGTEEEIWTCENNVTIKSKKYANDYFLLWNKKLYSFRKVEALHGVSHFKNTTHFLDWMIIPNKAMLFDTKAGQRVLDYCKVPAMMSTVMLQEVDLMK